MQVQRIELEPGLSVHLSEHEVVSMLTREYAWVLQTEGLTAWGQQEVAFVILRRGPAQKQFPPRILPYIPVLKHFASQGRIVRDGDISAYRAPGPFDLGPFIGLVFVSIPSWTSILQLPAKTLLGIFLTDEELSLAQQCGSSRILRRLGKETRMFPNPYWSDLTRKPVYQVADFQRSLLSQIRRVVVQDASATLFGNTMRVRMTAEAASQVADVLAEDEVIAVIPHESPSVTAALVWNPGEKEPEGIVAEGKDASEMAVGYVAFVPNSAPADDFRLFEDGYAAVLSTNSKQRLISALRAGTHVELRSGSAGRTLEVHCDS